MKKITILGLGLFATTSLSACGAADRLANVGKAPDLAPIENPVTKEDYQPVSMPMPAPQIASREKNSLWGGDKKGFFKDQRASDVGDILTVIVDIDDTAQLDNETERTRTSSESAGLNSLLGYEASLSDVLPEAIDNASLVDAGADSTHNGKGSVDREEEVKIQMAAIITQVLPNGNLVIEGKQEVRVNFEKRILAVAGVVRPEDISPTNTISSEQIAEARIAYGGEGQISDVQQPRYGQQVYDIIFPF